MRRIKRSLRSKLRTQDDHAAHDDARALKLGRRQFLSGSAAFLGAMTLGVPSLVRAQSAPPRKLILVTCNGGWDVSFHLDPKPDGLGTVNVPTGTIQTLGDVTYMNADTTGGVVNSYFQAHSDVSSAVRGISVRSISHDVCIRRMLTGSPADDAPDMGVITASAHAPMLPAPYLTLGAVSFPGDLEGASVRQGTTNQLSLAMNYDTLDPGGVGATFPVPNEQALISQYLQSGGIDYQAARGTYGKNAQKTGDYLSSLDRVEGLYAQRDNLGSPFALTTGLTEQLNNALTMLEQDVCWSVNVSTGFVWDHHDPAAAPTGTYQGAQGLQNQILWPALNNLVTELKTRDGSTPGSKMIDETVVVVLSEMTRTPLYNEQGGKDHWPYTSALVIGAGVNAGKSLGVTDDSLISEKINLATGAADAGGVILETEQFAAGILQLVGVDPLEHLAAAPFTAMIA